MVFVTSEKEYKIIGEEKIIMQIRDNDKIIIFNNFMHNSIDYLLFIKILKY